MNLIATINPENIRDDEVFLSREASRAVLLDENLMVSLLFVANSNYYKLPGGGIEPGEEKIAALQRECREEVGAEIVVLDEIGQIVEYRPKENFKQISYCFLGRVKVYKEPEFTSKEKADEFELVWLFLNEAITVMKDGKPYSYNGRFIPKRDLLFLQRAKEVIDNYDLNDIGLFD